MRLLYFRYLQHWDQIGGEDILLFSSLGEFSQYGSWGLLEYEGQPLNDAPKLQGVLDYLASVSPPAAGDYDRSGAVDEADYQFWRNNFGKQVEAFAGADGNGDGTIDAADYTVWRDHLEIGGGAVSLPEPRAIWLLLIAVMGLSRWARIKFAAV